MLRPAIVCVVFDRWKLLASGCVGDAYTWDVSEIVREASLDDLLSDPNDGDEALLDADTT